MLYGWEKRALVTRGGIIYGALSGVGYTVIIMGRHPPVKQTLIVFLICTMSALGLVLFNLGWPGIMGTMVTVSWGWPGAIIVRVVLG